MKLTGCTENNYDVYCSFVKLFDYQQFNNETIQQL